MKWKTKENWQFLKWVKWTPGSRAIRYRVCAGDTYSTLDYKVVMPSEEEARVLVRWIKKSKHPFATLDDTLRNVGLDAKVFNKIKPKKKVK